MYSLIICDLIVGCSTYTSIVIQPDVYAQETRHDVGSIEYSENTVLCHDFDAIIRMEDVHHLYHFLEFE